MITRRRFLERSGKGSLVLLLEPLASWLGGSRASALEEKLGNRQANPVAGAVKFVDVTREAGLSHARNVSGKPGEKKYLLETMGCGVAFIDFDNDGWLDIFLVNGWSLPDQASEVKPCHYLFRNNRDGTFTDVTKEAGITHEGWGQACCAGDYNNDGYVDIFVSYWGHNALYKNNGDGTFTEVAREAGVYGETGKWGAGCCFLDYDRDGYLDIFVASYVQFDWKSAPPPGSDATCIYRDIKVLCGPQGFSGGTNTLFRNRGDGTFEDVSEQAGVTKPRGLPFSVFQPKAWRPVGSYGMGVVAADFNNDGWPDIYVACDTAPSLLYLNNGDGTFREVGVEAGCAFDENGAALGGMGAAAGDYDRDGWLDIVRTNFSDQITTLYKNNGDGTFHDASLQAGLGVNTRYVGFGVGFIDYDNDGWKDIFIVNGHVYSQLEGKGLHVTYKQRKILYRNLGNGRFADVTASAGDALLVPAVSRGCAFGDFDNDGDVDVIINNLDDPPTLLRNDGGNRNHSVLIHLIGTRSNRSAIGARVKITTPDGAEQIDEVMSGSGYYSQNDLRLHFGLGQHRTVTELEVRWPSGRRDVFHNLPSDAIVTIVEGEGVRKVQPFRKV